MPWTRDSEEELKTLYVQGLSFDEIAEAIGRSRSAVKTKTHRLGLRRRYDWSANDHSHKLVALASRYSTSDLAAIFGRTPKQIERAKDNYGAAKGIRSRGIGPKQVQRIRRQYNIKV